MTTKYLVEKSTINDKYYVTAITDGVVTGWVGRFNNELAATNYAAVLKEQA